MQAVTSVALRAMVLGWLMCSPALSQSLARVVVDGWFNSQQRTNATGQQEYFHYKWNDVSNSGFSFRPGFPGIRRAVDDLTLVKEKTLKTYLLADPVRYPQMTTAELRKTFLLDSLYEPGALHLAYVDLDRTVVGMAAPTKGPCALPTDPDLRAQYFTERRELGALNVGGSGCIQVNGKCHSLENLDCLYIGQGNAEVSFESRDLSSPAIFYLLSYPAHTAYPVALVRKDEASPTVIGSAETCNLRTVSKYIYQGGVKSCQLVMGVTHLHAGSVWNTMPPHTHMRRSEVYLYFNLAQEAVVFHLMGPPGETRHLLMNSLQAVISPGWSIHAGVGTRAYSFCWGMGGENQDYGDMDVASIPDLR